MSAQEWTEKSLVAAYNEQGKIIGGLPGSNTKRSMELPRPKTENVDPVYGNGDYGVGL